MTSPIAAVAAPLVARSNLVFHFAAETHVDRSIAGAAEFIKTDVIGTYVLLEAARQASALRCFVQVSTDEVYGSVLTGHSRETDEIKPRNPYSASKAAADRLAYSFWATYGVPVVITRASNNYGPYQFPEKVIPLFATNAIEDRSLPMYGDGGQVRDWLHVIDHCRALDVAAARGTAGEVYNVGGGNELSNRELARRILSVLGKPETTDRAGHRPARARSPLRGRLREAQVPSGGRRRWSSSKAWRLPWHGIERTRGGGCRSNTTTRRTSITCPRSTPIDRGITPSYPCRRGSPDGVQPGTPVAAKPSRSLFIS